MKNEKHLTKLNINNLTSLWQEASLCNNSFTTTPLFNYSAIKNMNWPNRLWFNNDLEQEAVLWAKNKVFSDFPNLITSYWDIYGSNANQLLEQNGFVKIFEQIGMSLKINKSFEEKENLKINLISTKDDAIIWSKLFKLSFGYEIHPNIIINTHKNINYYITYYQGKSIGTAITYQTDKVTGIHAIGIIPEGRRKGLANELMKCLLNISIKNKSEYVTLQASDMGRDLYLKLGFNEQFLIKNYKLISNYNNYEL